MATVAHIIRSHYDPADREKLERQTGQRVNDQSDPWQTEPSFSAQRRIRALPTFVPATISYDEWGVPSHIASPTAAKQPDQRSSSTAEWYRSLIGASSSHEAPIAPPRPSSQSSQDSRSAQKPHRESITKNNWFISKVLRSEPSTKPSSPAPSLADLLVRDPPPLPSEGRYAPPVWLHIGPSNRGFGMLQRSGWNEGEGLGAHVIRPSVHRARDVDEYTSSSVNAREVIDPTRSDSEDTLEDYDVIQESVHIQVAGQGSQASHMQRSLLTPLPTILKADRLGIGLKAKTEGPYKHSKKRVTHSAAALAAHIRSAEEMRRKKAAFGKGRRGFAKAHKREENRRKTMLAFLNE
ncbi:hypothetical protein J3R82DRAFT_9657 [Butyriboletus roseoflavus]|nr:hypothetical protein J3R82DRAFT_9657 [Butyriboletus roseoflavus]